jgi:hypothetical protein
MDYSPLADGLRGNSRLKSFRPCLTTDSANQEPLAIADALKENKGLVDLELRYDIRISDEA